jgi:SAM-dependent methyltransferase
MTASTPYVFEGTPHAEELQRLQALEVVFDSATRNFLLATGMRKGWQCLEVGAGVGSIATWMSETVGPTGRVLAVDVNARFLVGVARRNLEVMEADIRTAVIEPESFDLVHARFVLIHIPDWTTALPAMIRCLKPGGWLVLEEPDFSSSRSFAGPTELRRAFDNVHKAIEAMFTQRGMDHAFGARLPSLFVDHAFVRISVENDAAIVSGGSPQAKMMGMSARQLRDKYVATSLVTERDIKLYSAFAEHAACWATYHGTIRAAGRKPGGRGDAKEQQP